MQQFCEKIIFNAFPILKDSSAYFPAIIFSYSIDNEAPEPEAAG
jgi:hypothetical protein